MSTFHCWSGDFTLKTQFYLSLQFGSYSLFSYENNAFSVMCDICRKPDKPVFWSRNTVRYWYSFWALFVLCYWVKLNINPVYLSLGVCSWTSSSVTSRCILGLRGCQVRMIANVMCTIMFYTFLFLVNHDQFLRGSWKKTANTRTLHSTSGWDWFFPCRCDWCIEAGFSSLYWSIGRWAREWIYFHPATETMYKKLWNKR